MRIEKLFLSCIAFIVLENCLIPPSHSYEMEGTCDGPKRCTVNVSGDKITTSSGIDIISDNIIGWSFTNTTKRSKTWI